MTDGTRIAPCGKMPPGHDRVHGRHQIRIVRSAQDRGIVADAQKHVRARRP